MIYLNRVLLAIAIHGHVETFVSIDYSLLDVAL